MKPSDMLEGQVVETFGNCHSSAGESVNDTQPTDEAFVLLLCRVMKVADAFIMKHHRTRTR